MSWPHTTLKIYHDAGEYLSLLGYRQLSTHDGNAREPIAIEAMPANINVLHPGSLSITAV